MPSSTPAPASRPQRVLAYMAAAMILVSIASIFALLIGAMFGASGQFNGGVWPVVAVVPLIALPLGIVMIVALVVVTTRTRARGSAFVDSAPAGSRATESGPGRQASGQAAAGRAPSRASRSGRSRPSKPRAK